jgi:hypothetical protein
MGPLVKPEDDRVWVAKDDRVWVAEDDRVWVAEDDRVWVAEDDRVWVAKIDDTCQLSCPTMIYRGFEEILIGQP